ncbi:hypothetical protein NP493_241g00032 [Ridgeia piscesae]|uniref:J domain-containing protein n=1 Tax=Ridgeia piscesae TaxID=27915 RepID=A0AAD9UDF0_RIDPI|nr:hypothetical protein NP493_241g00032 [Ridgeia piscesae]
MEDILSYQCKPEDDYYFILGIDELSSIEQINTEYKVKALECHPDKHPDDLMAVERFSRLQRAKQTLSDPALREQYDTWRRSGIAIPYDTWCAKRNVHTSMHWVSKKKKEPMLMNEAEEERAHFQQTGAVYSIHMYFSGTDFPLFCHLLCTGG